MTELEDLERRIRRGAPATARPDIDELRALLKEAQRFIDAALGKDPEGQGVCKYCGGSKIEEVYGGYGTVKEVPCSYCCAAPSNPEGQDQTGE